MSRALLSLSILALALPACDAELDQICGPGGCGTSADGGAIVWDGAPLGDGPLQCAPGTVKCGGKACCTNQQLCLEGKCRALGPKCDELWPCPAGYFCDKTRKRCVPTLKKCQYKPPVGTFSPKVEWEWQGSKTAPSHNQVMMAPMVANMTDDNGDGKIDRDDTPDIIFSTFAGSAYTTNGVLRVISGDGKKEHFSITKHLVHPGVQVAVADFDGDGKPEIAACASGGGAIAFEHDGAFKWKTAGPTCYAPAIADLQGDGLPEVVVGYSALSGATGKILWTGAKGGFYTTVADLDGDGRPEVVGGNRAFRGDGKLYWHNKTIPDGIPAIADLTGDGSPEVVTVASGAHSLYAHSATGKLLWGPVDVNQGKGSGSNKNGGGPPTIADFDGDGKPEIAAAGGWGYVVFEHDGKAKWFQKTQDLSSRVTGSSVFDFEGDGKAEVVYSDELQLRTYQGATGKVLFSHCNTSGTLWEYPIIVDVDNDGGAEIVVANNNYAFKTCSGGGSSHTGIKVLGDTQGNWVRTRRIWNQHTYHVTNVDEDGRVPKKEAPNWKNPNLNNFRQNVQPGGLFDAPDLTGKPLATVEPPACGAKVTARALVQNRGAARVAPGLAVTLYGQAAGGTAVAIQTVKTTKALLPGQDEQVTFSAATPKALAGKTIALWAMVDDTGAGKGTVNECVETNNRVDLSAALACTTVK